jgi:type II secretory pathway pseudopilin PulG
VKFSDAFMKSVRPRPRESGYVLLALMLTMTLLLVALAIEAPRIGQQIKRGKEEELVHRGKDYATAVKRFVHKNGGRYPVSVEQLENTNHIRFLRKKYVDPMTGDSDWKMVHVGEAEIKIPAPNPGLSGGGGQNPGLGGGTVTPNTNQPGVVTPPPGIAQTLNGPPSQPQGNNLGSLTTTGIGNGQTVGGGQIMGVASVSKGHSIKEFNDKDEYDQWYFVYDLRLEQSGGTGVTVAAPRGASAAGSSGTPNANGTPGATGNPGANGTPGSTDTPGAQNPPDASGQPTPTGVTPGTPAPTPPPQVPH